MSEKTIQEKDLMLQEMKHRIKNSIARVLAIARQTANHSESLDDFINSFTKRLQAMAAAQDLLTQSHHQTASLSDLLRNELLQVFDQDFDNYSIDGPAVELGGKATQALALVFHELATNALKYADMANHDNRLDIRWQVAGDGVLTIWWEENLNAAITRQEGSGFGTRLIRSLVTGELGGDLRRELTENGLRLEITVPAEAR